MTMSLAAFERRQIEKQLLQIRTAMFPRSAIICDAQPVDAEAFDHSSYVARCCGIPVAHRLVESASDANGELLRIVAEQIKAGESGGERDIWFPFVILFEDVLQIGKELRHFLLREPVVFVVARGRADLFISPANVGNDPWLLAVNQRMLITEFLRLRGDLQKSGKSERPHVIAYKKHVYNKIKSIVASTGKWMPDDLIAEYLESDGYFASAVIDLPTQRLLWTSKDANDLSDLHLTAHIDAGLFHFPTLKLDLKDVLDRIGDDYDPIGALIERRRSELANRPLVHSTGKWPKEGPPPFDASTISRLLDDIGKRTEWEYFKTTVGGRTRTVKEKRSDPWQT